MRIFISLLILFFATITHAQSGIKAGLTYSADEGLYKTAESTYTNNGKGNTGYHVAFYKRINLTGLYIQPELWYVNYKNEFKDAYEKNLEIQYKKIDVPVSVGTDILGLAYIQGGPLFSYYFKDDIKVKDVSEINQKDISLAFQLGAGAIIQNLNISVRYDFPLSERETKWVEESKYNFVVENSPKLFHVSIGYNF